MEVNYGNERPASQALMVAGRLLFAENFNVQLRKLIELLFAGWQLTPASLTERSPDIRIRFFCGDRQPDIPDKLNQFEVAGGGQCYTSDGELYLVLRDSLLHLRETRPVTVDVWFSELPGPNDPLTARLTSFAVCAALRRFGLFELHSAGVVDPENGKGVLIIGPSGSGKSTLALQLALAGWSYLSDDELLLSLVDGVVEVRGFRSFFAVSQENVRLKHCFEPDLTLGLNRTSQASPGIVLFASVNGGSKSELRKLTQAESMTRLIRACPWATYDTSIASANLELLSTLARQTVGFELFAARDLLQPGYAAELIGRRAATEGRPYS
jgi:hypothetical protein